MTLFHFHPEREELLIEFPDGAKAKVSLIGNRVILAASGSSTLSEGLHEYSADHKLTGISTLVHPSGNS